MRENYSNEPEQSASGIHNVKTGIATTCFLTLPVISDDVVVEFVSPYDKSMLNFGLYLYENGMIEDNGQSVSVAIQDGVNQWMRGLIEGYDEINEFRASIGCREENILKIEISNDMEDSTIHNISGLLELHKKNKRLAWIILRSLEFCWKIYPVMTPHGLFELICMQEWLGFENEENAVKEMLADGLDYDEIEILSSRDVYKVIPKWSVKAGSANWDNLVDKFESENIGINEKRAFQLSLEIKKMEDSLLKLGCESVSIFNERGCDGFFSMCIFSEFENNSMEYQVINNLYHNKMQMGEDEDFIEIDFDPDVGIGIVESTLKIAGNLRKNVLELMGIIKGFENGM